MTDSAQCAPIETRKLSKSFGGFQAVDEVSLRFEAGAVHAVLGENGAGKSTLLKLLFGLHRPSGGEILVDGAPVAWRSPMDAICCGLGMVQQHFSLVETLSAIDNVMLGAEVVDRSGRLLRAEAIARLEKQLPSGVLRVPWEAPVSELSVGEKQRVEILKLLFREAEVLFLDEPTAVLTPQETQEFFGVLRALKQSGRTVVLITHKINEVFQICDRYAVLRAGRLVDAGEVKSATAEGLVASMIGRRPRPLAIERAAARAEPVLVCDNVREAGRAPVRGAVRGLSLRVHAGEIVGVAGVEGSGQSALVDSIMGLRAFEGRIEVCGRAVASRTPGQARAAGCGLVPEDRLEQAIWLEESVRHNMILGLESRFLKGPALDEAAIARATDAWAKDFDVRASSLDVDISCLSGGNQQKAVFARETVGRSPRLLVCHQPTRGVDLGAIEMIRRRLLELRNQGLGVLLLSSDLDELLELSDRIVTFFDGRATAEFRRDDFDALAIGAAMAGAVTGAVIGATDA